RLVPVEGVSEPLEIAALGSIDALFDDARHLVEHALVPSWIRFPARPQADYRGARAARACAHGKHQGKRLRQPERRDGRGIATQEARAAAAERGRRRVAPGGVAVKERLESAAKAKLIVTREYAVARARECPQERDAERRRAAETDTRLELGAHAD